MGTFSFVDRITEIDPGVSANGVLIIPSELGYWSPCLLAEAVGQLAAWSAMARADFRLRPLAGIAGDVRIRSGVEPGTEVLLNVDIASSDAEAVAYDGSATVGGASVLELEHCLGPMFPAADFDDPDALRERFRTLCKAGAAPDRFEPLERAKVAVTEEDAGRRARATVEIPENAAFFADHFPRRPVYPATLLLDHQVELALGLVADEEVAGGDELSGGDESSGGEASSGGDGRRPAIARVRNAKMRSFVRPGQTVHLEARVRSSTDTMTHVALAAYSEERRVSSAQAEVRTGGR